MYLRIETICGEVLLKKCYDVIDCIVFYDVYDIPYSEEEVVGNYLGEFVSKYNFEEQTEQFKNDLDNWVKNL